MERQLPPFEHVSRVIHEVVSERYGEDYKPEMLGVLLPMYLAEINERIEPELGWRLVSDGQQVLAQQLLNHSAHA